jgi:hypothetical protein
MASTTSEITLQQLASVDAKLLFQALEMRLATAGVIKKRGVKRVAKTSSSSDDASSETSGRSVGEGTKAWNTQTSRTAALLKEAGIKGGAGFHLKVLARLKETGLSADAEPEADQVSEAATWLLAHPEWTSKNQQAKAKKAEESGEEPSGAGAGSAPKKPAVVVKKASAEEKKAEKEAKKAAEKAEREAKKAAEKADREAKKAAEKAEKAAAKAAGKKEAKAAPKKEEAAEAEEEPSMDEIEFDGVSYFWDSAEGKVYENIDGHPGELFGTWNGEGDIEPVA